MTVGIIILVIVVLLALWAVGIYNNLVKLRNNRENAFANIDVQLKQRHDLIPQLVATVKGYADHEKEVLMRVTEARSAAMNATSINDKIQAENALTSALAGLKISLEAYPDLKANKELNNAVQTFPSNLLAGIFGFKKEPMFEVPQTERADIEKAPEIKF